MNFQHFVALIKLRFQLSANQIKKAGRANVVISVIIYAIAAIFAASSFFVAAIGGMFWFAEASPTTILLTWNILVAVFIGLWLVGLLVELQQTELMSIDKLLHLPVSLRGAFFLNYTSSFLNSTFLTFVPLMTGLAIGMALARGWAMLLALPLLVALMFMVTALTYQLRGWLARIMENKRARGTVIAGATVFFVLLSQVPHLVTTQFREPRSQREAKREALMEEFKAEHQNEIERQVESGALSSDQQAVQLEMLQPKVAEQMKMLRKQERSESYARSMVVLEQFNVYAPPGWLPLGIYRALDGKWLPSVMGSVAMMAIGFVSLGLSYRSSMRKYTGVARRRKRKSAAESANAAVKPDEFMHWRLPWVSEQASAVAVSSVRGFVRAPETKIMILFPLIMVLLLASLLLGKRDWSIPDFVRPWLPVAVIAVTMFSMTSTLFNQFGVDRDGFRAFLLSPIKRRDILLGKNIAMIPLAFGVSLAMVVILQIFSPLSVLAFLGAVLQIPAVFLLYCMLGNAVSIFFPMGIKRGSMQPANPRFLPVVMMVLASIVGPSLLTIPSLIACAIPEFLKATLGYSMGWLYLLLSAIQLGLTWYAYVWLLGFSDRWLWMREPKILDVVANVPE